LYDTATKFGKVTKLGDDGFWEDPPTPRPRR